MSFEFKPRRLEEREEIALQRAEERQAKIKEEMEKWQSSASTGYITTYYDVEYLNYSCYELLPETNPDENVLLVPRNYPKIPIVFNNAIHGYFSLLSDMHHALFDRLGIPANLLV